MKKQKNKKGFTLIELLVVVLIIGVLAAIALPHYRRAVAKAQAAQLQTLVSSVVKSIQRYYMVQGKYPISFDEIDLGVEWKNTTDNVCDVAVASSNKGIRQSGDYQIILNYREDSEFKVILGLFSKGQYKCTGIAYFIEGKGVPLNQLICEEATYNRGTKNQSGDFCEKVMGKTYFGQKYSWWQFY